ncbi:hypothetical protein EYV94_14365 [Puteibacter caeruleilacunae]|nr:hypothetical protein EYV94_14365 [Puteibacter caeruleilacunae]
MSKNLFIIAIATLFFLTTNASEKAKNKEAAYLITASEVNKVLLLDNDFNIIRKIDAKNTYDAWQLKNGSVFYNRNYGAELITPSGEVTFKYDTESEVFACQPLKKDLFLIGECTKGRLIEVSATGDIKKTIPLTFDHGGHTCFRNARKLKNGNYLVAHYADKTVREYNAKGEVIKEIKRPNHVYMAQRLKHGQTAISDQYAISVYDKNGKLIWEFDTKAHPELGVYHLTGFQFLDNGDVLICNWLGHRPYHKGVPLFKVTKDKKVTWKYTNAEETYSCTNIQAL